uniref:Uncharacterized protein n=1 Tax=Strongyloides stercoralis TaxID=6248 RepID=A0AAF5DMD7_STRER
PAIVFNSILSHDSCKPISFTKSTFKILTSDPPSKRAVVATPFTITFACIFGKRKSDSICESFGHSLTFTFMESMPKSTKHILYSKNALSYLLMGHPIKKLILQKLVAININLKSILFFLIFINVIINYVSSNNNNNQLVQDDLEKQLKSYNSKNALFDNLSLNDIILNDIAHAPVRKPGPKGPIRKPGPKRPIRKPGPKGPIRKPGPKKPIRKPGPKKPIKKPIRKPGPKKPIKKPIKKPGPKRPIKIKPGPKPIKPILIGIIFLSKKVVWKSQKSKQFSFKIIHKEFVPSGTKTFNSPNNDNNQLVQNDLEKQLKSYNSKNALFDNLSLNDIILNDIAHAPVRKPGPKGPIRKPGPKRPIRKPGQKGPIRKPGPKKPIRKPGPKKPIKKPIKKPGPKRPIKIKPRPKPIKPTVKPAPKTTTAAPEEPEDPEEPEEPEDPEEPEEPEESEEPEEPEESEEPEEPEESEELEEPEESEELEEQEESEEPEEPRDNDDGVDEEDERD